MAKTSLIKMAETMRRVAQQMTGEGGWACIERLREAVGADMPATPGRQYTDEWLAANGFRVEGDRFAPADSATD